MPNLLTFNELNKNKHKISEWGEVVGWSGDGDRKLLGFITNGKTPDELMRWADMFKLASGTNGAVQEFEIVKK